MSWSLTALGVIKRLAKWSKLTDDARYFAQRYIIEFAQHRRVEQEVQGATAIIYNLSRRLQEVVPHHNIYACWGCGMLEFTEKEESPSYLEQAPEEWINNMDHRVSSFLCPQCQQDDYLLKDFLYQSTDHLFEPFVDCGTDALPEFADKLRGLESQHTPSEWQAGRRKVLSWLKQIANDLYPYGEPPKQLLDESQWARYKLPIYTMERVSE